MAFLSDLRSILTDDWLQQKAKGMQRDPYPAESTYFLMNPGVAGMAAKDNRITLNPRSKNSPNEQDAVRLNEMFRLSMKNTGVEPFPITFEQQSKFNSYGKPEDIRSTIISRILSGDPSSGRATPLQTEIALKQLLKLRNGF